MATRRLYNDNWKFAKFEPNTDIEIIYDVIDNNTKPEALKESFAPVDIPHDWMIHNTGALYESSVGLYTKTINLDASMHNLLYFEGVYMNTTIYLNRQKIFFWPYGYSSFEVDLTQYQKDGDNELIVYVNYLEPNTRWYSGAGIFRDVWLNIKNDTRIVTNGVYASSKELGQGSWSLTIDSEIVSTSKSVKNATLTHEIFDGEKLIGKFADNASVYTEPNTITSNIVVNDITSWDINNPKLYTLITTLCVGNEVVDTLSQNIGFRTINFDPNEGFFLNGRHVKIHGACMHHDLGSLGSAFNSSALRRQFRKLQEMGINAVRTSHNPPSVSFMDIADEMGMLIDSEAFDMWEQKKTENDYGVYFHDYCERDVESWIRRDRNHPSVIMWSIGNEIPDTHTEVGYAITIRLRDAVRRNDYRHNAYTTIGSNYVAWEGAQKCSDALEVSGYNYLESIYEDHHNNKFPHWCIYGSETASTVQSRGIYHFPKSNRLLTYEDMQCSALDNCSTNWGAKSVHKVITDDRDATYCAGQFIWTGWDYIGEPTPYFSKNSFFGHIDTAGFYKDTFYIFKSAWVSYKDDPFVHIGVYWDFNPGQLIDINVFSNAPKIELYFNDELVGQKLIDTEKDLDFSGHFILPFSEGTLKAVAYDEAGNVIATDEQRSFSNPEKIVLTPENCSAKADGEDLLFLAISVVDKNGVPVANARNRINVKVEGEGRLVGLDNGDSTDYDQYKTSSRKLFSGKLMALIAPTTTAGDIKVTASGIGLEEASVVLTTTKAPAREGISCGYSVPAAKASDEVPVRKITIIHEGNTKLGPDNKELKIHAVIEPQNATYQDITFKAVTLEGIKSNSVKIDSEGTDATITALGDGEFRIICSINNGKPHSEVMSELECSVSDLGSATIDAYDVVHACQYVSSNKEAILSFRGGVNFMTDDNTITFDNVDFGEYGSDELAFFIYSWRADENLEIWDGEVGNSELLFKGTYSVTPEYNVFQENTFKLSKRIKGVRGLTFRFEHGFVFGGFRMIYKEKAYGEVYATEYNMITGDSYDEQADGIYSIGNNVDIEFTNMNFKEGIKAVSITGRSHIPSNPVHVRFHGENGDINQICEFPANDEITTISFPLESVSGENKVNFIFMPGSKFDFVSFKFE